MAEAGEGGMQRHGARRDRVQGAILLGALALLAAGLFLPAITVRKLVFSEQYSLLGGVIAFFEAGDYFLFAVTLIFTVLFPVSKVLLGLALWLNGGASTPGARRLLEALALVSKYSMLDVFIIALTVLVLNGQLLTSAEVHSGVIAFAGAVVLSTWGIRRLGTRTAA